MAIASDGFVLDVVLVDGGANTANMSFPLTAADYATAVTDAGSIIGALGPITGAVIKTYTIREVFIENSLTLPGAGVHVENRALVNLQLSSNPLKTAQRVIPAAVDDIYQGLSGKSLNRVDVNNVELRTFIGLYHAGGEVTISDGESVAPSPNGGIIDGVRAHRKSYGG